MAKEPSFKIDNPVFRFFGRLGDVVLLNLLWLMCSLPVVTAGASTTALFFVARKLAVGEDYSVRKDFFRSFRANFKQATALGLGFLAFGALCFFDLWTGLHTDSAAGNVYRGIGMALGILWLAEMGYAFPTLARYEYTTGRLLIDAFRLSIRRFPTTVLILLLCVWLPALLWLDLNLFMLCFPIWLFLGPAASAVAVSALLAPAQEAYERRREEGEP